LINFNLNFLLKPALDPVKIRCALKSRAWAEKDRISVACRD